MDHALRAVRDEKCIPRPGERHVEKTPLLIRVIPQRDNPFLCPGNEHHGELEPFGRVEREELTRSTVRAPSLSRVRREMRQERGEVVSVLPRALPDCLVSKRNLGDRPVERNKPVLQLFDCRLDPAGGTMARSSSSLLWRAARSSGKLLSGNRIQRIHDEPQGRHQAAKRLFLDKRRAVTERKGRPGPKQRRQERIPNGPRSKKHCDVSKRMTARRRARVLARAASTETESTPPTRSRMLEAIMSPSSAGLAAAKHANGCAVRPLARAAPAAPGSPTGRDKRAEARTRVAEER